MALHARIAPHSRGPELRARAEWFQPDCWLRRNDATAGILLSSIRSERRIFEMASLHLAHRRYPVHELGGASHYPSLTHVHRRPLVDIFALFQEAGLV